MHAKRKSRAEFNCREYSFVLAGRLGALLGEEVVYAEAGDLMFKPRDQWHTFWNAGDTECSILEIISPAGFEHYFEELGEKPLSPEDAARRYGPSPIQKEPVASVSSMGSSSRHHRQADPLDRFSLSSQAAGTGSIWPRSASTDERRCVESIGDLVQEVDRQLPAFA